MGQLNQQTLTDLTDTRIGRAARLAIIIVALVDGISPLLAALLALTPFFFTGLLPDIRWAYYSALAMALLILFGLGMFLGRISRENMFFYGLKTVVAGLVSILLSSLLDGNGG